MRSVSRVADVSINTVAKLLVDAGEVAADFHDRSVRNVAAKRVQVDEIWSFCYSKDKNVKHAKSAPEGAGNVWTWSAIDADSKMILSWLVGSRDGETAWHFMMDLKGRLANRVQLTSDGLRAYVDAVGGSFGDKVDFAQLVKIYGAAPTGPQTRYSPAECIGANKTTVFGQPDERHISTSYSERQHLTMRMSMRRFTRLTNGFSKKFENHCHALALYFFWYNWTRQHKAHKLSPAMAAGLTDELLTMADLVALIDRKEGDAKRAKIAAKSKVNPLGKVS